MNALCIETDMTEDAISSIELASDFLTKARSDHRYWKWFVVALHSAVQGTFALALDCGNGLLVQKPGRTQAILASYANGTEHPGPHMDNFQRLYEKVKQASNLRAGAEPFVSTDAHDQAISALDELRDEFLHFNTKLWAIEVALILNVATSCLQIVDHILTKSFSVLWYEHSNEQRAAHAIGELRRALSSA